MAKVCPETKDVVLYADCLDCKNRLACRNKEKAQASAESSPKSSEPSDSEAARA